ncbi:response regulator transcription factor [Raoultibacter phocaeensis]|uniref:response regulator transcription factor n=1 Tax=Raoultibacter phocaeensis TaxID=2479841 RepID=UPI0011195B01|nr:response regulator transcription factor [Raoultibacter phocaeensis]
MQILIVEDDARLAAALGHILEENGYKVDVVHDGKTGLEYGESGMYDVIILDVMLPKMNGFDVVAELRRRKVDTAVLMLTARDAVPEKITGLDSGADDYMTKPFSPAELLAHLRALTRRQGEVVFETLEYADLTLNLESFDLTYAAKSIHLGLKEFSILKILMLNPNQVISKETLISKVWGIESSAEDNNVEAYISFLRKKLKFLGSKAAIETLRKAGYRLTAERAAGTSADSGLTDTGEDVAAAEPEKTERAAECIVGAQSDANPEARAVS